MHGFKQCCFIDRVCDCRSFSSFLLFCSYQHNDQTHWFVGIYLLLFVNFMFYPHHDFNSFFSNISRDSSFEHYRECISRKLCLSGNKVITYFMYRNEFNNSNLTTIIWYIHIIIFFFCLCWLFLGDLSSDFCVIIEFDNISKVQSLHDNNGDTIFL